MSTTLEEIMSSCVSIISDVLLYEQDAYYLTIITSDRAFRKVPESWGFLNGFEYKEDAYAYLAKIRSEHATNL